MLRYKLSDLYQGTCHSDMRHRCIRPHSVLTCRKRRWRFSGLLKWSRQQVSPKCFYPCTELDGGTWNWQWTSLKQLLFVISLWVRKFGMLNLAAIELQLRWLARANSLFLPMWHCRIDCKVISTELFLLWHSVLCVYLMHAFAYIGYEMGVISHNIVYLHVIAPLYIIPTQTALEHIHI
jgi:hypothetical protein